MTTATVTPTISLDALPPLGGPLEGGRFAGLTTGKDGKHYAVALLPEQGSDLNHQAAQAWAAALGGTLPTRPVAALLFANLRDQLRKRWHWTEEQHEDDASYAWGCHFSYGYQSSYHKSYEGCAVAVRLIPLSS